MLKILALAAAGALLAGAAQAQHGHADTEEKMVCKMKGPGDAAAKEVPCEQMKGHGPGRAGHGPGGHRGGGHSMIMRMHHDGGPAAMDANKDGRISLEEFSAPMREHFQELDKNKSGYLETDEMPHGKTVIEKHIEKKSEK